MNGLFDTSNALLRCKAQRAKVWAPCRIKQCLSLLHNLFEYRKAAPNPSAVLCRVNRP